MDRDRESEGETDREKRRGLNRNGGTVGCRKKSNENQ